MSWYLARSLDTLRTEIHELWPHTAVWTIGDKEHAARASDHNPHPDTRAVCAIDVVGIPQSEAVTKAIIDRRDNRMKYMIWRSRIMSGNGGPSPWVWRTYTGPNPHNTHAHISVGRGPDGRSTRRDLYDDPARWWSAPDPIMGGLDMFPRHGDRSSDAVAYVQRCLDRAGYRLTIDGNYGDETAAQLARFFKDRTGQDTNGRAVQSNQLLHLHRALFDTPPVVSPLTAEQRAGIDYAIAHRDRLATLGSNLGYLDVVTAKNRAGGLLSGADGDARYAPKDHGPHGGGGGSGVSEADAAVIARGVARDELSRSSVELEGRVRPG